MQYLIFKNLYVCTPITICSRGVLQYYIDFDGTEKSSKDDFSSLLQFLIKSVVVKSTLNVSCVENLMSLMAAGLAEELVIYTLDSRILM